MSRRRKHTDEQIREMQAARANGSTVAALAALYNVSRPTMYAYLAIQFVDAAPVLNTHGQIINEEIEREYQT